MAKYELTAKENEILRKMYWNSGLVFVTFTMTKMEANAFTMTMEPALNELYKDDPEGRKVALRRHNQFFNTHAVLFALIAGLTFALEKEKVENGSVTDEAIDNIKVALMGPTAGIGDAFFFNAVRVIAAGIGIGLCEQGNILGTIIFILLYGGSQMIIRWYLLRIGYTAGTSFINTIFESGLMDCLIKAAAILGMTMVGSNVASQVNVKLNWVPNIGGAQINVLEVINSIMPGLLSILLVFFLMSLLRKGFKPVQLVLGILVCSVVLAAVGIF